ncbi:MAG: type II secretion system protein [Desulfonatronovibrio sp. MSAO_Bac4]|nr:MAG: type II secretion system protein [Desulfonatronovibrio sp. MSAO_Bac4]
MKQKDIRKSQGGFTLIEIIAVLVILGILAAVAVPRFLDLSSEAEKKAVEAVAGNLSSASALNYAAHVLESTQTTEVGNCTAVAGLLEGGLSDGYTITAADINEGNSPVECTVTGPNGSTATFSGYFATTHN